MSTNPIVCHGVDASSVQREIFVPELEQATIVAPDGTVHPVEFCTLKAIEDLAIKGPDPFFKKNWQALRGSQVAREAYDFFHPEHDPILQAEAMVRVVGDLDDADLGFMLDAEYAARVNPGETFVRDYVTYDDRIQALTGRRSVFYTGLFFWDQQVEGGKTISQELLARVAENILEVAAYVVDADKYVPHPWRVAGKSWDRHQCSGDVDAWGRPGLRVRGIKWIVDHVRSRISVDEMRVRSKVGSTRGPTIAPSTVPGAIVDEALLAEIRRPSQPPDTIPSTPTSKSSQNLRAVDSPIVDGAPSTPRPTGEEK